MYCIGVDQSYTNIGIAISKDGVLIHGRSHKPDGKTKAEKRLDVYSNLIEIVTSLQAYRKEDVAIVYERIRMYSKGFVSMPYIVATAALCGTIQEVAFETGVQCYSVDTRAWKKAVVGTVEKQQNDENVQPEKYPTILWARNAFGLSDDVVDTDMCDALAISQTWWKCKDKLKDELK